MLFWKFRYGRGPLFNVWSLICRKVCWTTVLSYDTYNIIHTHTRCKILYDTWYTGIYLGFDPFGVCVFVPMFSGWHKSKEANYGTRLRPFSRSYAVGNGSHAPPFSCPSCLFWSVLRERANYGSRLCQFPTALPGHGSHAPRFVWDVYLMFLTANYGNRFAHHISQVQA